MKTKATRQRYLMYAVIGLVILETILVFALYRNHRNAKAGAYLESKVYFSSDQHRDISSEAGKNFIPATMKLDYSYHGQLNNEKRYLSIGFDDFRDSDFSMIIPLFEKYGFRATFNQIVWSDTLSKAEKGRIDSILLGGHELGNHTFRHQVYIFSDPMCNGQDPDNLEGGQIPFPTNDQIRGDRGDGKNVFGISLSDTTASLYTFAEFDVAFKDLTDKQCQTIREFYSLMKDPSGLCKLYDKLSNRYLGTTGSSNGSWDEAQGCYTGGIFTGCKTSANHEVWERVLLVTDMFFKDQYGLNGSFQTWSLPGDKCSPFQYERDGEKFYDEACTVYANYTAKVTSSLTQENRSWTDVLRNNGYTISHDYLYPARVDGQDLPMMSKQFIYNASMSRPDALLYPTNMCLTFENAGEAFTEDFFSGDKSRAAQMYDNGGAFYEFIEAIRQDTSNGMVHGEVIDSMDSYSERMLMEQILRYCKQTGVEVITKAEAYDLCFHHKLYYGNLIYNPRLRNTAKEFMPDAENVPDNPDGYTNTCHVSYDEQNTPILNVPTSNTVEYLHYGVPTGNLTFALEATGCSDITIYAIKNSDCVDADNETLEVVGQARIDSPDAFETYCIDFQIQDHPLTAYEQLCEGYGDKIMGIKIVYGPGICAKNMSLTLDHSVSG